MEARRLAVCLATVLLLLAACGGSPGAAHPTHHAQHRPSAPPTPTPQASVPGYAYKGLTDNPAYQWWTDPQDPQPDSWWGTAQTRQTLEAQATIMDRLGVRVFRVELPWSFVAPGEPGGATYDPTLARDPNWPGYDWSRWDLIVSVARWAGLVLVPQVVYAPTWATGVPLSTTAGPNSAPLSPAYFADFMTALVTRYGSQIHYWELWNEPDNAAHTWAGSMQSYVDLVLQPGYQAVKAVDPSAQVLLGGLASVTSMGAVYQAGGGPYFDIANFHAYFTAGSGDATALSYLQGVMREHGDGNKPIWMSEFGYPTNNPTTGTQAIADPASATGEAAQAALIRDVYSGLGTRMQAILYYELHDTIVYGSGGVPQKYVYWGLTNRAFTRDKPGYYAFQSAPSSSPVKGS